MEKFFLLWPDDAYKNLLSRDQKITSLSDALLAIRSGKISHIKIESYLLDTTSFPAIEIQDKLIALCFLYFDRIDLNSFQLVVEYLRSVSLKSLRLEFFNHFMAMEE